MKKIDAQILRNLLDNYFEQYPDIADKMAETRLIDAWHTVLGTAVSRFTEGIYIRKKTLYVKLTSSVLKSELLLFREQLIDKLNGQAGRNIIDNIVLL
jgi:hypothetical protein